MQPSDPAVPPLPPDQLTTIGRELDALVDAIDGLSDALTAEAAYQMARGNTSRLASTLTAIAQGDAPPPELEVARTPRSGTAVTHRLLVLFSGAPVVNPGWLATNSSIRASCEPMLNAWASKLLGDATKVRCTIQRLGITGAVAETRKFPLSALRIAPLDMVYGVEADTGETPPAGTPSEIEQYALYQAKRIPGGFNPQANLRFQHTRPADLAPDEITLFDALEQARALRRLLSRVRGVEPEDLNPPERAANGAIHLLELENRVLRAENGLNAAHSQLAAPGRQGRHSDGGDPPRSGAEAGRLWRGTGRARDRRRPDPGRGREPGGASQGADEDERVPPGTRDCAARRTPSD